MFPYLHADFQYEEIVEHEQGKYDCLMSLPIGLVL